MPNEFKVKNGLITPAGNSNQAGGLKLTGGTLKTTPTSSDSGSIEYNGTNMYIINSSGVRKTFAYTDTVPTLEVLTIGTGLTGTSYNGSSAVTIAIDVSTVTTISGTQTLSNKSFYDANFFIIDNSDTTKKLQFELSGLTGNTTRTLTVPDASGTIALTSNIPTVNNATLTLNVSGNGLTGSQTFSSNQGTNATFTVTSNATNLNTASSLVFRDASGNFSAGTITANLTGTATSANNITGGVAGDLLYQSAAGTTAKLPIGSNGQLLSISSGLPDWVDTNTIFLDKTTGNVGVGTITPEYKIDAIGGIRIKGGILVEALATPTAPTGTGYATGGSLAAGTYYAKIVALDVNGANTPIGPQSTAVTVTGSTSRIVWTWTAVPGAFRYQLYFGTSVAGTYTDYFDGITTNTYTLTTTTGALSNAFFGQPGSNGTGTVYTNGVIRSGIAVQCMSNAFTNAMGMLSWNSNTASTAQAMYTLGNNTGFFASSFYIESSTSTVPNRVGIINRIADGPFSIQTSNSSGVTSEVIRVTGAGKVGINTTTPTGRLEVNGGGSNDSDPEFRISGVGFIDFHNSLGSTAYNNIVQAGDKGIIFSNGTIDTGNFVIAPWASSTSGIRITSAGLVGIGITTPGTLLDVNKTGAQLRVCDTVVDMRLQPLSSSSVGILGTYSNHGLVLVTNSTERSRIDTNGYHLLGYTSSNGSYRLQVNSQIFATSATIATSDGRYKENVTNLTEALKIVNALRPVSFDWKQHPVHNFDRSSSTIGFIAQEVEQVLADKPYLNSIVKHNACVIEAEEKDDNGNIIKPAVVEDFLGLAESNLVAILTKAIQEQHTLIVDLNTRISALESNK